MRRVDSSGGHQGGPVVRGQARAAEVHAAKAEGRSPSRAHWREAPATPAVEVSFSPVATAAASEATSAPATVAESSAAATEPVTAEPAADTTSAAAIVAEAIVASSFVQAEPGMYVDVTV